MNQKIQDQHMKKYVFWAIILLFVIVSFYIIKPFIVALISAFILAYLIRPLHEKMSSKMNKKLSATLCIIIILMLIIAPLVVLASSIISQMNLFLAPNSEGIFDKISSLPILENINLNEFKDKILSLFLNLLGSIFSYVPSLVMSILITVLGVYYILIDWNYLSKNLEGFLPFEDKKRVREEISQITKSIVHGYILIALSEFIVAFLGFYFFGVNAFLILSFLIAIFAFIPGVGPGVVWVPTFIYYLIDKDYFTAFGVLLTGLIISIIIETILLGRIVGKKSRIHPLIFLIGVLGGVPIFGIFGFIIGPLILVYSIKLIEESIKQH